MVARETTNRCTEPVKIHTYPSQQVLFCGIFLDADTPHLM
jgi:hypothetical protein